MNPDDMRLFDRWTVIKINARGWELIRQLAEVRQAKKVFKSAPTDIE